MQTSFVQLTRVNDGSKLWLAVAHIVGLFPRPDGGTSITVSTGMGSIEVADDARDIMRLITSRGV